MKTTLLLIVSFLVGSALIVSCGQNQGSESTKEMETVFVNPPDSIQTSVYWYWISDNISKEGVENDLISMKKAGINRAFIGYIGQDNVPYGEVKIFSDEWWDILHAALKKATELDIEIGIFNSPGWSQSGGPWVEADEAMRYLATSEVKGALASKSIMKFPFAGKLIPVSAFLSTSFDKPVAFGEEVIFPVFESKICS